MNIIKLDAIPSTNDFLKAMSNNQILENFTIVTANYQTNGKGQRGAVWQTERDKNIIMSMLARDILLKFEDVFYLNVAVALAVTKALEIIDLPKLSIKWPNDIMADNKKIGGILIENRFKSDNKIESIIGIGLNVNQINFDNLPKASSLALLKKKEFELNEILERICFQIKKQCSILISNQHDFLWNEYHKNLFKLNIPMTFSDNENKQFMGIIRGVNYEGRLKVQLNDDSIKTFDVKEIQMLF